MREKRKRDKVNQEWAEEGLSPLATPETTPEPDLSPSGSGGVDYSVFETPGPEAVGGQTSGQQ